MKKSTFLLGLIGFIPLSMHANEISEIQIIPDTVARGHAITFDMIGVNSSFNEGTTVSFEPPGFISVDQIYILEPTRLMVQTVIAADAPPGIYTVIVTTTSSELTGTIEVTEDTTTISSTSTTTTGQETPCPLIELYGEDSEEIVTLRYLRDNVLSKSPEGREIIILYYRWSLLLTVFIQEDATFREKVREIIDSFLRATKDAVK